MDILESKLKDFINKNKEFISDYKELRTEVSSLRDSVKKLEKERVDLRLKIENIIEKLEVYLTNTSGN